MDNTKRHQACACWRLKIDSSTGAVFIHRVSTLTITTKCVPELLIDARPNLPELSRSSLWCDVIREREKNGMNSISCQKSYSMDKSTGQVPNF
jgi:hypothetical protein